MPTNHYPTFLLIPTHSFIYATRGKTCHEPDKPTYMLFNCFLFVPAHLAFKGYKKALIRPSYLLLCTLLHYLKFGDLYSFLVLARGIRLLFLFCEFESPSCLGWKKSKGCCLSKVLSAYELNEWLALMLNCTSIKCYLPTIQICHVYFMSWCKSANLFKQKYKIEKEIKFCTFLRRGEDIESHETLAHIMGESLFRYTSTVWSGGYLLRLSLWEPRWEIPQMVWNSSLSYAGQLFYFPNLLMSLRKQNNTFSAYFHR